MAEKKNADKKPKAEKAGKTRKGKADLESVQESLHKVWLAGLGAVARAEEEGGKLFKTLVARGEDFERRGRTQVDRLVSQVETGAGKARQSASTTYERLEGRVDDLVGGALRRAGIPGRDEIATLTRRVEELTRTVEGLKTAKPAAPAPATAAAATATKTSKATKTPRRPRKVAADKA
jgi:poly(hydroxyalkanoate) granule-associated protein